MRSWPGGGHPYPVDVISTSVPHTPTSNPSTSTSPDSDAGSRMSSTPAVSGRPGATVQARMPRTYRPPMRGRSSVGSPERLRDAMSATDGALHVARQALGVLAGEANATDTFAQDRPERHHLPGTIDRVTAAGVTLVGPRHRRDAAGGQDRRLRIDRVQLLGEGTPTLPLCHRRGPTRGVTGNELTEQSAHRFRSRVGRRPADRKGQVGQGEARGTFRLPEG